MTAAVYLGPTCNILPSRSGDTAIKEEQVAKNMRIGHFIETGIAGGAEQVMIDLCRYTEEQTNTFTPVVLHFDHPWIREQCEKYGIEHVVVPFRRHFKSTARLPLFALEFAKFLKVQRIDILHSHLFGPITGAAGAAALSRIPHVGTLHDVYMLKEKPARRYILKLARLFGTKFVTVSKNMENYYRQICGFNDSEITTIYNGIEIDKSNKNRENSNSQNTSDSTKQIVVICVGRLIKLKNIDLIVKAFSSLSADRNIRLEILGEGPEHESIANEAGDLLNKTVFLRGVQNNVDGWLSEADIFVQFSTTEGLSRSILEAISTGLPVIASNVGGNSEIVRDRENGILVESENLDELTSALEELVTNSEARQKYGKYGQNVARKYFSRSACNRKYLDLYCDLLKLVR